MTTDSDVPPFLPRGEHPIHNKRYVITTPQVEALCAHVVNLVENRTPGGVVFAPPRTGKSCGIEILKLELETVFPGLPVLTLPVWDYTIPREGAFLEDLLAAARHAIVWKGNPNRKRERLVELMAKLALDPGHDSRIVLIVDEAQQLHERHYRWLMGIHNLLVKRGVELITVLVGQHQLVHQRSAFLRAEKDNIVGRFMVHMFEFHGIRSAGELKASLEAYDQEQYPEGSGWSFTRYFLPARFSQGWRLGELAPILWSSFGAAWKTAPPRKRKHQEIPMQYFCRTAEYILTRLNRIDMGSEEAIRKLTSAAIAASGYLNVLLLQ